jgi:hypothetical protein
MFLILFFLFFNLFISKCHLPTLFFPFSNAPLVQQLHCLKVLSVLAFLIFLFLDIACPFFTQGPPPFQCPSSSFMHNIPIPPSSVCQGLDHIHPSFLLNPSHSQSLTLLLASHGQSSKYKHIFLLLTILRAGDIELNPGPNTINPSPTTTNLHFVHLNTCSISSITPFLDKPAVLQEFISDEAIEILTLSETWLSPDTLPSTLTALTPPNFLILSNPRCTGRGGGVAIIYRSYLKITKFDIPSFPTFEALCIKVTISSKSYTILTIYRPPSTSIAAFVSDFTSLLDNLNTQPSELIISGDFNIHVDTPTLPTSSSFLSVLDSSHLQQHVHFPTHKHGHTLDLLISRATSNIVTSVSWTFPFLSDHFAIHAILKVPTYSRPPHTTKFTRSLRSIDVSAFSNDILNSPLHSTQPLNLDSYISLFNSTLSSLVDKHAPLKSTSFSPRTQKPYITPIIRAAKSIRSKLETIYRRTRSLADLANFKHQSRALTNLITSSKRHYYRSLIVKHKDRPRQLWAALNSLLSRKSSPTLPITSSFPSLAASFLKFFDDKISKLCLAFNAAPSPSIHIHPPRSPPSLQFFQPATTAEIRTAILSSNDSTCSLDIIPTSLLKSSLPALLLPITTLVNLSLSEGIFPSQFKHALVKPLLKKHNLPSEDLSSYRPISNLNFISKIIERIIHNRLTNHLSSFQSVSLFQSAYRKFHSTETALLRIQNDLLLASDQQQVSALILLDLSAAFDTIDHHILLTRLSTFYGITGPALKLLESYLHDRTQSVTIGDCTTPPQVLRTGVPQGSVLGPLLFSLYTSPIGYIFPSSVSYHLYADDTQLYLSFSASETSNNLAILSSTLDSLHSWFMSNRLTVNPSKTEYLIIGTHQQRSKVTSASIQFQNTTLNPSTSARNLGVVFENDLSLKKHISSICQTSFFHIRCLRQIRSSLDLNSAIILANSLVSSRLDYCNSLFYGLPDSSVHRLQRIQNSLARAVMPSFNRRDHITPALHKLHWLPIHERIVFKIATITFKVLNNHQPAYLFELLTRHNPSRSLRSSSQNLLSVPRVDLEIGRRSFKFAAPTIWNRLPLSVRSCSSLSCFRSALKTHLFPSLPP